MPAMKVGLTGRLIVVIQRLERALSVDITTDKTQCTFSLWDQFGKFLVYTRCRAQAKTCRAKLGARICERQVILTVIPVDDFYIWKLARWLRLLGFHALHLE